MMQNLPTQPLLPAQSFIFWLQGFFELGAPQALSEAQTTILKEHLAMCFEHRAISGPLTLVQGLDPRFIAAQSINPNDTKTIAIC